MPSRRSGCFRLNEFVAVGKRFLYEQDGTRSHSRGNLGGLLRRGNYVALTTRLDRFEPKRLI